MQSNLTTEIAPGGARSALVCLAVLFAVSPVHGQIAAPSVENCVANVERADTSWCLVELEGAAAAIVKSSPNVEPLQSVSLPIRRRPFLGFEYAFGSIWVGYPTRGRMGLLRVDAETLAVQADTGMRGWTHGVIAVGSDAIWVLSARGLHGELRRFDPRVNAIVGVVEFDFPANDLVTTDAAIWVAMERAVVSIDPQTLTVTQTFAVPPDTGISSPGYIVWNRSLALPPRVIKYDGTFVLVALGELCRKCFLGGVFNGPGQPTLTGRVDPASGTVVLVPNQPGIWEF